MKQSAKRREFEKWRTEYRKAKDALAGAGAGPIKERFKTRMVYAESKMQELRAVPGVAMPKDRVNDEP